MKTILQIAKEIGVSKQAVYKRFKGKLYTEIFPYIHTKDGTTYILEQGEDIIKIDFSRDNNPFYGTYTEPHTEHKQDTLTDTLILMLQKELERKNKQIEELTEIVKTQAASINAAHHNELAETIIPKLESEKKKGFISRIFKKK